MRFLQRHSKGQVLLLVALLMVVVLGAAALAIDIGRAYGVKAKLNAAVDAASYEAAKAMAKGNDEASMKANAAVVAGEYFSANYPSGFLGATPTAPTVSAVKNEGIWHVTVSASAKMPTSFAAVLGWKSFDISATSEAVRDVLDMVLVLDTSNSLASAFQKVKQSAVSFIDHFNQTDDRLGLVAFSTGAFPVVSICRTYPNFIQNPMPDSLQCERGFDKSSLTGAINALSSLGTTASEEGMIKALAQLNSLKSTERSSKRIIVFFSDGVPNTFNGKFPLSGGGTVDGNLFSEVVAPWRPNKVYDQTKYYDAGLPYNIASLPTTDISGTIPTASYNSKRILSGDTTNDGLRCDANIAARNMVENVANMARNQGVTVYTLGLGPQLNLGMEDVTCSTHEETGTMILKRLANTKDSDSYDPRQPEGMYCYAATISDLTPCFDKLASIILRITK